MNSCYYNTYLKRFPLQYKTTSGLMAEHPVNLRNCYLILMMDSSGKDGWSNWSPNKISGNCWTLDGKIVKFSWKRLLENYTNRQYWVRITQTGDIEYHFGPNAREDIDQLKERKKRQMKDTPQKGRKKKRMLTYTPSKTKWHECIVCLFIRVLCHCSNFSAISWQPVLVVEEAGETHRPWTSN